MTTALTIVGIVAIAAVIGYLLYRGDTRVEKRRYHALEIAKEADKMGLEWTGRILRSYAVGDYSGIVHHLVAAYEMFKDDEQRKSHFLSIVKRVTPSLLKDGDAKVIIYKLVDDQKQIDAEADRRIVAAAKSVEVAKAK